MAKTIGQLTAHTTAAANDELPVNASNVTKKITVANLTAATLGLTGNKTVANGTNLVLGTGSGTQIGTAAAQKLGFFGATPADQPALTADLLDSLQELGLVASGAGNTPLDLSSGAVTCGTLTCATLTPTSVTSVASPGAITSSGTAGVGYATGAGGTVTQATSRTTAVTLDKTCGSITMFSAAGSATAASFTVNNSTVAINDCIVLSVRSSNASNKYVVDVTAVAAGSFEITFRTTAGTATDTPVINFAVIKAVTS